MSRGVSILMVVAVGLVPARAQAFCGFYVGGATAELFNDATQVVLMRAGSRTVVSMQNHYEGPPEDFAMVVPVPTVLREGDVRTLPDEVFDRVDQLGSPRLVEYWEQDPCAPYGTDALEFSAVVESSSTLADVALASTARAVTVEARFEVGEYEIVILSARDSRALDTWLRTEGYNIPARAEQTLRPYVAEGMKFFVAKVDVTKVRFEGNRAKLSPLRFFYDSNEFRLPIRLGMLNAQGEQDLIVSILAPERRYRVANYDNVAIPTNLELTARAREQFGPFYAGLLSRVFEDHPGAVVTEYAWDASSCDPCPGPALSEQDLATLGADVYGAGLATQLTLTRLHARYDASSLGQDLVFEDADPIVGGREIEANDGQLEQGAASATINNFQARYIIRHRWEGRVACQVPQFGRWGGWPPSGEPAAPTQVARDVAFIDEKVAVADLVEGGETVLTSAVAAPLGGSPQPYVDPGPSRAERRAARRAAGGGCQGGSTPPIANLGVFVLGLAIAGARRRRRS